MKLFKILDLYIAKKFLTTLGFILLMAAIVAVIFDVSEKTEDFLRNNLTLKTIVFEYYFAFIPNIINLISPLIIFISALYFTSRMANQSEIIPILSSGISYRRLLVPYMAVGVLLMSTDLVMKNFIIPKMSLKVIRFEERYVEQGYNYFHTNIHRKLPNNTYFYIRNIDYNTNQAYHFTIEKFDKQKLIYKLHASEARIDTTTNTWKLKKFIELTIKDDKENIKTGDSMDLKIPITKKDFGAKVKSIPSMTTPELIDFIEAEKFKGEDINNYALVEKYKRFSLPFAILVLILIAVSLSTRKIRGGMGAHLLLGILIAVSYDLFLRFSTTFSTNANFPPLLAVWIPNILYIGLAMYLLKKTPK